MQKLLCRILKLPDKYFFQTKSKDYLISVNLKIVDFSKAKKDFLHKSQNCQSRRDRINTVIFRLHLRVEDTKTVKQNLPFLVDCKPTAIKGEITCVLDQF